MPSSSARRIINNNFIKGVENVFVWIDGKPIGHLASHLVKVDRNNPQAFLVDAGPIGGDGCGGILPALQGGYWLMLAPLPPGPHQVMFGATVPELDPLTGEPTGERSSSIRCLRCGPLRAGITATATGD